MYIIKNIVIIVNRYKINKKEGSIEDYRPLFLSRQGEDQPREDGLTLTNKYSVTLNRPPLVRDDIIISNDDDSIPFLDIF